MRPLVVALVLCSALMHAAWNLLARRRAHAGAETIFFARMLAVVALLGLLPIGLSEALTRSLTPKAWACAAGSGLCFGLYFYYLARAYSASDFTVVYPVARALPILFVAVGDVLRGRYPSAIGWTGILLVTAGCFLAPLHSLRDVGAHRYFNRASLWMLLAALGTTGFTLLDKIASEALRQQGPGTAVRYGYVLYLIAWAAYLALTGVFKTPKPLKTSVGWRTPVVGALLTFGGYSLVVWAYQMSRYATYILAFRQFSIVVGVILAFLIYRERGVVIRLAGTFSVTAGLVLIGFWGT
jgi:drug/metabolite transporter (DMT)-like permease